MGRVIQLPSRVLEPFRLDGQADELAGTSTMRLLTTQEALNAVIDLRKTEDSQELRGHERVLRAKLSGEQAYLEVIQGAFTAAEWLAPTILRQTAVGDRAILLVFRQDLQRKMDGGAAFDCTSKGSVLVANRMLIIPKRPAAT